MGDETAIDWTRFDELPGGPWSWGDDKTMLFDADGFGLVHHSGSGGVCLESEVQAAILAVPELLAVARALDPLMPEFESAKRRAKEAMYPVPSGGPTEKMLDRVEALESAWAKLAERMKNNG